MKLVKWFLSLVGIGKNEAQIPEHSHCIQCECVIPPSEDDERRMCADCRAEHGVTAMR